MQVSGDMAARYIGRQKVVKNDNRYYFISLCDTDGNTIKFFSSEEIFDRCDGLKFGDELTPVFEIYSSNSGGVGTRFKDFLLPPS